MRPVELRELRELRELADNRRIGTMEDGAMWFALFSIACAAAVCLSVAAVVLQASQGDALRG
jgi:hypothetical protein